MEEKELHYSDDLKSFVSFLSFSGNGHSLLSSLIDAHGNAVVSREQRILTNLYNESIDKEKAIKAIIKSSANYTKQNRPHKGSNTSHLVPNQHNGTFKKLEVVGDKNGWGTVMTMLKPKSDQKIANILGIYPSLIHIYRNPFDVVAHTRKFYPKYDLNNTVDRVLSKFSAVDRCTNSLPSLSLSLETLISHTSFCLRSVMLFLGLTYNKDYLTSCSSIVEPEKIKEQKDIKWTTEAIDKIYGFCESIPYLKGYKYEA